MLKLEKIATGRNINVRLTESDKKIDPFFWKALFIAFLIHLTGFVIFHIEGIRLRKSEWQEPVFVSAEIAIPTLEQQTIAAMETEKKLFFEMLKPKESVPELPALNIQIGEQQSKSLEEEKGWRDFAFRDHEFVVAMQLPFVEEKPVEVLLSGMISDYQVIEDGVSGFSIDKEIAEPMAIKFLVQIDDRTGKVVSREVVQSTGIAALDSAGENILTKMELEAKPGQFVTTGEIEVRFK